MGEPKTPSKTALAKASEDAMVVQTMGGRMHVRWDETARATPHGQLVFFAEFLATAGVFDRWVEECPLSYSSPNASSKRDVLGTLMLGILSGSKRYAHIAGIRGDAVAAHALGMRGVVSEDSVRRALKAMELPASETWMRKALMDSVRDSLNRPWVLDLDATIKPLYGHQEGAEVGYNPHKPGRPSHVLHTFWIGNLRLVLDAVLTSGKQHTSGHGKAPLARLLDELGDRAPALVRGDCGYGNEDIIDVCEQRGLAVPAAAAQDDQRQAPDRAAVQARGLEPREPGQPGLAGDRGRDSLERLEQGAPRGGAASAHQARHRGDGQARRWSAGAGVAA